MEGFLKEGRWGAEKPVKCVEEDPQRVTSQWLHPAEGGEETSPVMLKGGRGGSCLAMLGDGGRWV